MNTVARGRKGPREGLDAVAAVAPGGRNRIIWDANKRWEVTGITRVRDEGQGPTGDAAVDEAYDGFGATYGFWEEVFGRDSIDDEFMPLRGVVHFGDDYPNAFWDGRRMTFGDGDGELFRRFTRSLDVIGHELGHGVIEDEAALEYWGQSGALNEHIADVAGIMVKQRKLSQTVDAGGLADRRRAARPAVRRRRAALDEGAGHRLRRSGARQGPAAGALGRLRPHVRGQRRRAHQLGHPEQGVLPALQAS